MTVEVSNKLSLSVEAYRRMTNRRWDGSDCIGEIELTAENCSLAIELDTESLVYTLNRREFEQPAPGQRIEIHLQPQRGKSGFFAKNIDELLAQAGYTYDPPVCFYISDLDELYPDPSKDPSTSLQGYLNTIKLAQLLRTVADHEDTVAGGLRLVFLHKEKLDIPVVYTNSSAMLMCSISEFEKSFTDGVHRDQRRTIFKNILLDELKTIHPDQRFEIIIQRFSEIQRRFVDNYQLYVSEFSFDKVLKEVSDKRLEYVLKLNKNFSDIQNQILAVPIAALLAASQITRDTHLKNALVFMTALIFSGFISMLLRNQKSSLNAIKNEIDCQHTSLKKDYTAIAPRFEDTYKELSARYTDHKRLICVVDLAIAIILVIVPDILFMIYSVIPLYWK